MIIGERRSSREENEEKEQTANSQHRCNQLVLKTYMTLKQNHCTPTCAIPSRPAAHSNVLIVLQHATSALEAGRTSILANAHVPEVVPRRMKYGDIPSDVPRAIIR